MEVYVFIVFDGCLADNAFAISDAVYEVGDGIGVDGKLRLVRFRLGFGYDFHRACSDLSASVASCAEPEVVCPCLFWFEEV